MNLRECKLDEVSRKLIVIRNQKCYLERNDGNSFFELAKIDNELENMLKEKSCGERQLRKDTLTGRQISLFLISVISKALSISCRNMPLMLCRIYIKG